MVKGKRLEMQDEKAMAIIHDIFGVNESFKLPDAIMEMLFDKGRREIAMRRYLKEYDNDLSFDGFHKYYEAEQANRKKDKQDFTPDTVATIMSKLVGGSNMYYEPAAGTGGIVITKWWNDIKDKSPFFYKPSKNLYRVEELSDRALPFLLFNLMIRGMNAIVIHGDVLERSARGVFFVQNDLDTYMAFSSLNVMPYSDEVMKEFEIKEWTGERYPEHIESKLEVIKNE